VIEEALAHWGLQRKKKRKYKILYTHINKRKNDVIYSLSIRILGSYSDEQALFEKVVLRKSTEGILICKVLKKFIETA